MRMSLSSRETWMRIGWMAFGFLIISGSRELFIQGSGTGTGEFFGLFSGYWGIGLLFFSMGAILLLAFALQSAIRPMAVTEERLRKIADWIARVNFLRWAFLVFFVLFPTLLFLGPWGWRFDLPNFRLFVLIAAAGMAAILLSRDYREFWLYWALFSYVATALLLFGQRLALVTDDPFPLSWSEGNRLWDYSLYFGRDRYEIVGEFSFPSYLTPGRHGLWGLPFLVFPRVTIMGMRTWDAILGTFPFLIFGLVLFSKGKHKVPRIWRLILAFWTFLFLTQGLIQAPLILAASLLVWGFDSQRKWRTIAIIAAASFYAGISRWTWMVAPGIWAAVGSVLLAKKDQALWDRLKSAILFATTGILGAAGSLIFMDLAFPRNGPIYATSLSQPLLWDRLWSNPTNPSGIVPALLQAVGPMILFVGWAMLRKHIKWDALHLAAVGGTLVAFLAIGLVASVKIGGGSNLHNLDMFLVSLVLLVGIIALHEKGIPRLPAYAWGMIAIIGFIPLWTLTRTFVNSNLPANQFAREALATIRVEVMEASKLGEVLFMDQRQLLTFGQISDIPLVMDYELKHVMNQAMSNNLPYFDRFYQDLKNHRFSLIVSDPLHPVIQGPEIAFAEENNTWVEHVTLPMLEYYEPLLKIDEIDLWLLVPAEEMED